MFREVRTKLQLKLLPSSLSNVHGAVLRELSIMLLRIEPTLGGVPLSIKSMKIEGTSAPIFEDHPHVHVNVAVNFLLFAPEKGSIISGIVNNLAEDTVGLLILDTFNAVIPKDEIPPDFAFDYKGSSWTSSTSGQRISIGSEVLFSCKGMRTTDQGLIQVLATFISTAGWEPPDAPTPKKSKKQKLAATAAPAQNNAPARSAGTTAPPASATQPKSPPPAARPKSTKRATDSPAADPSAAAAGKSTSGKRQKRARPDAE
jgi:DNA-directed RNA polymerase subunit E'/Rpb7